MTDHPSDIKPGLLDKLFLEMETAGVDFARMHRSDLELVMNICNKQRVIMWIQDFSKLVPYFINDAGKEYYGFPSNMFDEIGFEAYQSIAHPDDFESVHSLVAFFKENPKDTCKTVCRVRHHSGEYRWFYALDRGLSFTADGKPAYLISISYDVEKGLELFGLNDAAQMDESENLRRYLTLSPREKKVLHLLASEMTNKEIATELFIEASTVASHRRNIIKKLGAKSSMGIVKYAVKFSDLF